MDCRAIDLRLQAIDAMHSKFRGTIEQQVPLYSAVHVGGKKLYTHARKQEASQEALTLELPSRQVTIYELQLLNLDNADSAHPTLCLDVACSSGTYIRS